MFKARRYAPVATYVLLGILTAVFMLEVWLGGSEDGLVLIRMGGLVPESVRGGQWWRLLSCTFLHAGFKHFLFNAYVLFALGSSLERLMGARRFLKLYWVSAIAGSAASAFLTSHTLMSGPPARCGDFWSRRRSWPTGRRGYCPRRSRHPCAGPRW